MPYHFKPLQFTSAFFRTDAGFLFGDIDLLLNGIHAGQVGQQQPAATAFGHQHTVTFYVQLGRRADGFHGSQHVHAVFQFFQFIGQHRGKAGVAAAGGNGVVPDLFRHVIVHGADSTDAAPQCAADL